MMEDPTPTGTLDENKPTYMIRPNYHHKYDIQNNLAISTVMLYYLSTLISIFIIKRNA